MRYLRACDITHASVCFPSLSHTANVFSFSCSCIGLSRPHARRTPRQTTDPKSRSYSESSSRLLDQETVQETKTRSIANTESMERASC